MSNFLSKKIMTSEDGRLLHWCPGCKSRHIIAVEKPFSNGARWTWNGDAERPAFYPSINIVGSCHYFILQEGDNPSVIQYQTDCTHELNGQTVELPDFPEYVK